MYFNSICLFKFPLGVWSYLSFLPVKTFFLIKFNPTRRLVHESIVIHRQQLQVLELSCQGTFHAGCYSRVIPESFYLKIFRDMSWKRKTQSFLIHFLFRISYFMLFPILLMPNRPEDKLLDHHGHPAVLWRHRDRVHDGTPLPRCPPHPDLRSAQEEATDQREEGDLKFNARI